MNHPINAKNWIDRTIEAVSPAFAARRYAARAAIEAARSLSPRAFRGRQSGSQASYRGAVSTRVGEVFSRSTSFRGGSTADRIDQGFMRDRARKVYRDNVIGRSLLDTETDNIVAEGFSLQMKSASPEFNKEAEARFYDWLDSADITGKHKGSDLFRMSWREPRKDGDGAFILQRRNGYPKLQYIPGDLIRDPLKVPAGQDRREWYDGVRCDPAGRPIEFNFRDVDERGRDADAPIDARDVVFLSHLDDPLGVRGSAVYGPIFEELNQLDAYKDAVIIAARMACIFGLILKKTRPSTFLGALNTLSSSEGTEQKAITLENGMLNVMGTDESVVQVQAQQPMSQTPDFIRAIFRIICLRFDMPLEIGQKDLSQVNFSGGRIGLIGFYRSCRVKQTWLKSHCWERIVYWWLSIERQRQRLGFADAFKEQFPDDYGTFELQGREWDYNDPQAEALADLIEVTLGTKSVQMACAERGRDYQDIRRQRLEQITADRTDKLPVVLSSNTRDEKTAVTAVDADGNPMAGASAPLNGIQITAAIDVLTKLTEKTIDDTAATELLARVGIAPDRAEVMVAMASKREGSSPGDRTFQREVLKQLLTVPAAREAVYNSTDIEDLIAQTGLPPQMGADGKALEVPFIPVIAPAGQPVSGYVITDSEGDVVGGDVVNNLPEDAPEPDGSTRNVDPPPGSGPADGSSANANQQQQQAAAAQTAAIDKLANAVVAQKPPVININVPQQPAPVVNVAAPIVNVAPPAPAPTAKTTKEIIRDERGLITEIRESTQQQQEQGDGE